MKVTLEKKEKNQVHLAVEIEPMEVDTAWERAYRQVSRKVLIPGFRKGKAPRALVERHVGAEVLRQEALEDLIPDTYSKALVQAQIEPITQPHAEVVNFEKGKAATFKYTIEVRPEVTLGSYLGIKVSIPPVDIQEADIQRVVEQLRRQKSTTETVDRPVEEGDIVTLDLHAKLDGIPIEGMNADNYVIEIVKGESLPGVVEALLGMKAG
ncbi:MAG: trigger factor, partial [Cyanobacteria bacterium NC_groundwater_1444_Ag_S-0.65um_54_12]|nr:trigger factor [Cyanobacteria bacterium NC_groundwater_1444_Ag_S-0.65um_54_12]